MPVPASAAPLVPLSVSSLVRLSIVCSNHTTLVPLVRKKSFPVHFFFFQVPGVFLLFSPFCPFSFSLSFPYLVAFHGPSVLFCSFMFFDVTTPF